MEAGLRAVYAALAGAFAYPAPGRLAALQDGLAAMPFGEAKTAYGAFVARIGQLSLGEWEELHTHTLDLNPLSAPYVGYQMWGDSYRRGVFLAELSRELSAAGVETGGELPDHLSTVLRYLSVTERPLPQLVEALGPSLERMLAAIRRTEPDNSYLYLLRAVQAACEGISKREAA